MVLNKKFTILTLSLVLFTLGVSAQNRQTRQEYINKYKFIAVDNMESYGIPASITMAQGVLESDSGNSPLAQKSNNHFGIKCKSSWQGDRVYHDDDAKDECFRAYSTVERSYADHAEFLSDSPRYDALFSLKDSDYKGWAKGLKKAGYATASDYAEKLIKIIEDNDLYLLDQENGLQRYADLYGGSAIPEAQDSWFAEAQATTDVDYNEEGVNPNGYATTINAHMGYKVHRNNGVFFVIAKKGDTYAQIAEFFDITERRLRSYNDIPRRAPINVGDVIYIARKQSKWREDSTETHTVKQGETMHSVSQDYAITVKSLRRINKLEVKYSITPDQVIRIK